MRLVYAEYTFLTYSFDRNDCDIKFEKFFDNIELVSLGILLKNIFEKEKKSNKHRKLNEKEISL